jgi:hypothetical protein
MRLSYWCRIFRIVLHFAQREKFSDGVTRSRISRTCAHPHAALIELDLRGLLLCYLWSWYWNFVVFHYPSDNLRLHQCNKVVYLDTDK